MALLSNDLKHDIHRSQKLSLLDTCAISDIAKSDAELGIFDKLLEHYSFMIPTPVLVEVAFGSAELIDAVEALLFKKFTYFESTAHHDYTTYTRLSRSEEIPHNEKILLLTPISLEENYSTKFHNTGASDVRKFGSSAQVTAVTLIS